MRKNKLLSSLMAVLLIGMFCFFAIGSGESTTGDQGASGTEQSGSDTKLGEYNVEIKSCRLAKDYLGEDVAIITYAFTNNSDDATSFTVAFDDVVYQDGIGLNKAYVLDESAKYSADNQTKEIKKGSTLDVEVAYELNDLTTDLEVEVEELFSFNDSVVKKVFKIAE